MTSTIYEGHLEAEHLLLHVGNGTTYTTKMSTPYIVQVTYQGTTDAATSVSANLVAAISGRTITFYTPGDSSQTGAATVTAAYVSIFGRK
jgi:hypothetical protein